MKRRFQNFDFFSLMSHFPSYCSFYKPHDSLRAKLVCGEKSVDQFQHWSYKVPTWSFKVPTFVLQSSNMVLQSSNIGPKKFQQSSYIGPPKHVTGLTQVHLSLAMQCNHLWSKEGVLCSAAWKWLQLHLCLEMVMRAFALCRGTEVVEPAWLWLRCTK